MRSTFNDKWIPEVDISYFFTKNIAAELVLTVPQKHDVMWMAPAISAPSSICRRRCCCNTTSIPKATFRPYVGAGINYTILGKRKNVALGRRCQLDNHSFGA